MLTLNNDTKILLDCDVIRHLIKGETMRAAETAYKNSISEFSYFLQKEHSEHITASYLGGSVAREDHIAGISDIDIYLVTAVIDNTISESISNKVQLINTTTLAALMNYCESPLSVAYTDINSIRNGSSFLGANSEFYDFIDNARLLTGTNIKDKIKHPDWSEMRNDALKQISGITHIALEADAAQIKLSLR